MSVMFNFVFDFIGPHSKEFALNLKEGFGLGLKLLEIWQLLEID